MNGIDNKKDSLPCLSLRSASVRKGVRDDVVVAVPAQVGGAVAVAILYSIYPAHLPAGDAPARRLGADAGPPHRHPHAVDGPDVVPRPRRSLQRLPPRLLAGPLVAVAAGPGAGGGGAGAGAGRPAGGLSGGRHRGATPRQARLRQGPSPRRLPLDAHVQGVAVGPLLGHPGDQREVSLRLASVGVAGARGPVPHARSQRTGGATAQDADRAGPPTDLGAVALVPRPPLHPARRWRLRQPRAGAVLPPASPPADAGEPAAPAGPPVRGAARAAPGPVGPAADPRRPAPAPAGCRCRRPDPTSSRHRPLVRWQDAPRRVRQPGRAVVQGDRGAGAG